MMDFSLKFTATGVENDGSGHRALSKHREGMQKVRLIVTPYY